MSYPAKDGAHRQAGKHARNKHSLCKQWGWGGGGGWEGRPDVSLGPSALRAPLLGALGAQSALIMFALPTEAFLDVIRSGVH